jgi:hypothetical protein
MSISAFYTERNPKARKQHKCEETSCRRTKIILPGKTYWRISGKYDGDFFDVIFCERCKRLRGKVIEKFEPDDEHYPVVGQLLSWIREARRW